MTSPPYQVHVAQPGDPYSKLVADALVDRIRFVLSDKDRFSLALTGGNTPRPVYARLASRPYRDLVDWSRVEFFWGDERAVPPDHQDSNFRMARETLLQPLGISSHRIHRMPADEPDLESAARQYQQEIVETLESTGGAIPSFDLILLGMGDDGHTASLFPGTAALHEHERLVVANDVPQLKTRRLTFTYPLINGAQAVWFLVTGANKAPRIAEVFSPDTRFQYPCQDVQLPHEPVRWYLDASAAAK